MKHSHSCPKCRSRRFLVTSDFQVPDQDSSNGVEPFPAFTYAVGMFTRETFGKFEMWTCAACGFTEWYATGLETLDISRAGGRIRYIDAGAPAAGPGYR